MSSIVSVVVPIYKVEKYLDKCINSIVNQTYKNLEIILVDDGSPDNCPQICDNWAEKDTRIKVIHKFNEGLGMARNTGIKHATGDYICFVDSDDYIDIHTIEKSVSAITKTNSELVIFGAVDVDISGNRTGGVNFDIASALFEGEQIIDSVLLELISHDFRKGAESNYCFSAWSGLFSLSVIKDNNLLFLSEREIISEDSYFLLEFFSKVKKVYLISEILYFHFVNSESLTTSYRYDRQEKNNFFLQQALILVERLGYPKEIKLRIMSLYHKFTIAALKQIIHTDLKNTEKKKLVNGILKNPLFKSTLKYDVLKTEKKTLQLFFYSAKIKFFFLCGLMLLSKK